MNEISFGALKSPLDLRTFTYVPTQAVAKEKGGTRWAKEDHDHQHKVGICTAIDETMRAQKFFKRKFSPDFQYLLQKKFVDVNIYADPWTEGSSISSALKVGNKYGFLPLEEFTWVNEQDRFLPYDEYIAKLKAIPEAEITRLLEISKAYKVKAYAKVTDMSRNGICNAIDESDNGVATMFMVGKEWWSAKDGLTTWNKDDIQPLRKPVEVVSGHAVTMTNYDGNSWRISNSWGQTWCDDGSAYGVFNQYTPTEVYKVWYEGQTLPDAIVIQQEKQKQLMGQIIDLLQKLLTLIKK